MLNADKSEGKRLKHQVSGTDESDTRHNSNFEYYDEIFGQVSCLVVFRVGKPYMSPCIKYNTQRGVYRKK